ncbi:unnamed protein product [Symbiodinium natans]|uniref:Uncharacterized protein n=1 Tax=Symbiodinium natans TaxID=878477 RepID=A0A812K1C9_9DINO|nr:unnamed protein product [Symbiodinium natans]
MSRGGLRQLLRCPAGKYDPEEKRQHEHTRRLDHIGVALLFVLYVALLHALEVDLPVPEAPCLVSAAQLAVATLAVFNLYVEIYVLPRGTKEADDDFLVTYGPFGRWIYLTHQTIGALALHAATSAVAPFVGRRLVVGTYAASPVVGAFGVFVTVQYFNLVFSHPDHQRQCQVWAARGVRFGFIDCLRHSLPIIVAIFDIVLKHQQTLHVAMPSAVGLIRLHLLYVTIFLGVIHLNHQITGRWPYGFMKDLGLSFTRWLVFLIVQGSILSMCGLALSGLASLSLW